MLLSQLIPSLSIPDVVITGITQDSRAVKDGFLFVALKGAKIDGASYIDSAIQKGAVAVLAQEGTAVPSGVSSILVKNPRALLAQIAARFYPAQPQQIAAVTGTSGKTSTVQFLRQIWQKLGHRASSMGTLGIIGTGYTRYGSLTTPDPITLHADVQMLATEHHITHLAMEASSHGLDQHRLDGVRLNLAAFTNFSRDHLDYHQTMAEYFNAKARLFTDLLPASGSAVLNADIPEYERLCALVKKRGSTIFSFGKKGDLQLLENIFTPEGQNLKLRVAGTVYETSLALGGAFQSSNVLCASALAIAGGEEVSAVMHILPQLEGVRGRLERVGRHKGGAVYVDYAHKPDALENLLAALRPHTAGRLIIVFGCGGNRDAGKRPIMGEIAIRLADIVIVTDDNPRLEDPALIRTAILKTAPTATEIADRRQAIAHALSLVKNGDVLVIAGKGHEQGQIIGHETLPFDDAAVAKDLMDA